MYSAVDHTVPNHAFIHAKVLPLCSTFFANITYTPGGAGGRQQVVSLKAKALNASK